MSFRELIEAEQDYRLQHTTNGCRITHMIGVPLLLSSPLVALVSFKAGLLAMILGLIFQLVGHLAVEQNFPSLLNSRHPLLTMLVAIKVCAEDWKKFLATGALVAVLLVGAAAEARPCLPVRVARAVLLVPFRIPAYLLDTGADIQQGIALKQKYGCHHSLSKLEQPDKVQ